MTELIQRRREGFLLELTLNRPEKRNALNQATCTELADALDAAAQCYREDKGIRAVLVSGNGRAFCAGADLGDGDSGVYQDGFLDSLHRLLHTIVELPMPVIANVQGPAVGAGTQLALACDLRVIGERGWFMVPAANLGFALDAWTINRAQALLGGAVARSVLLGAAKVEAARAVALGFADAGDAQQAVELAQAMAAKAPLALEQLKVALNASDSQWQLGERAQQLFTQAWASADAAEARAARAEGRSPRFEGR